jgi:hypothetical protein
MIDMLFTISVLVASYTIVTIFILAVGKNISKKVK